MKQKTYYDINDKKKIGERNICYGHTGKDVYEGQKATK
jgi:lysozyme